MDSEWRNQLRDVVKKYVDCLVYNEERLILHPPPEEEKIIELYSNPWGKQIHQVILNSPHDVMTTRHIWDEVLQEHRQTFDKYNHNALYSNIINTIFFPPKR